MIRITKSKTLIFSFFIVIINNSCSKSWLDEKADIKLAVPTTLPDFQALLDNADELNQFSPALGEMGSDGHYITDAVYQSSGTLERNAYSWTHLLPYTNVAEWAYLYRKIFTCNVVLEGLKKIKPNNDADRQLKDNLTGQALYQRAFAFYDVAQCWAPPYVPSSANTEPGIPLRLESDINIAATRSTVSDTYDQIVNDLENAKLLLPIAQQYKTMASKIAVYAMLSRVYLTKEDYDKSLQNSDSCLKLYSQLVDYNSLDSTSSFPLQVFNKEVIFHSAIIVYGSITFNCLIDTSFYNQYLIGDLRRPIFFQKNSNNTITFKGSYTGNINLFNGLATDEIYLTRAESFARKGDILSAMNDLNYLMTKRWRNGSFTAFTALNQDDALNKILIERKKELLLRGIRWSDLRRLNRDNRFKVTLLRTIGSQTYQLEPGSYNYTFPIPDDVIQNTGMTQNPGW